MSRWKDCQQRRGQISECQAESTLQRPAGCPDGAAIMAGRQTGSRSLVSHVRCRGIMAGSEVVTIIETMGDYCDRPPRPLRQEEQREPVLIDAGLVGSIG